MLNRRHKKALTIIMLSALLVGLLFFSLAIGQTGLGLHDMWQAVQGQADAKARFVLFDIRLPRLMINLMAGMALGISGHLLQSLTRNALADPGLMGINAGAGVGVTLFFLFQPMGLEGAQVSLWMPLIATLSGLMTAALITGFAYSKNDGLQMDRLIITGIGFSMAASGAMILLISSADRVKLSFISRWLSGSMWGADWRYIVILFPLIVLLAGVAFYKSNTLNVLNLADETAIGLGTALMKERLFVLGTAVVMASLASSVAGSISFLGLMAPHMAKTLVGPRHQVSLPVSALLGMILLVLSDTAGLHLLFPRYIPAGIIVALIGAPYFMSLLRKSA